MVNVHSEARHCRCSDPVVVYMKNFPECFSCCASRQLKKAYKESLHDVSVVSCV